jgi:hypothetical protein
MEIAQQVRADRTGPVNGGVVVADEVIWQRLHTGGTDRIEGVHTPWGIKLTVVVYKGEMILLTRLPIQLGEKRQTVATAVALSEIGMDGVEAVGYLLQVYWKIGGIGRSRN